MLRLAILIFLALSFPAFAQIADVTVGSSRTIHVQPGSGSVQVCVHYCDAADPVDEVLTCKALANDLDPVRINVTDHMVVGQETCFRAIGVGTDGIYSTSSENSARGTLPANPTLLAP